MQIFFKRKNEKEVPRVGGPQGRNTVLLPAQSRQGIHPHALFVGSPAQSEEWPCVPLIHRGLCRQLLQSQGELHSTPSFGKATLSVAAPPSPVILEPSTRSHGTVQTRGSCRDVGQSLIYLTLSFQIKNSGDYMTLRSVFSCCKLLWGVTKDTSKCILKNDMQGTLSSMHAVMIQFLLYVSVVIFFQLLWIVSTFSDYRSWSRVNKSSC